MSTCEEKHDEEEEEDNVDIKVNENNDDVTSNNNEIEMNIHSFSLKKMASYDIPKRMSSTKLKDGFQIGYLLTWFIAICLSSLVVIIDWLIVIIFNINICNIDNNYDSSNLNIKLFSFNSFGGLIQQIWLTVICLGGFGLTYLPSVIGIDYIDKRLRNATISVFILPLTMQIIVNLFLVPIKYNLRSIFNAITLLLFFFWAYFWNKCDGIRAIYPMFITIFMTVILYYAVGMIIFSKMSYSLYALIYPLYLTFTQNILLKIMEYLDICKCCKNNKKIEIKDNDDNNNNDHIIDATKKEMDIIEKWRNTAPANNWPLHYIYFMCSMIVVMAESFRLSSYVILAKQSLIDLVISLIISIIIETLTRNLIFRIIYDKYIMKKDISTSISNVKAIFLGCKYHTDYIPILLIISCNILSFGHTNDCYYSRISYNMDITTHQYQWLIPIFFIYEMITDLTTFAIYKLLKRCNVVLHDKSNKPLKMAFIVLTRTQMCLMMISLGYWSFVAFIYDDASRPQPQS